MAHEISIPVNLMRHIAQNHSALWVYAGGIGACLRHKSKSVVGDYIFDPSEHSRTRLFKRYSRETDANI